MTDPTLLEMNEIGKVSRLLYYSPYGVSVALCLAYYHVASTIPRIPESIVTAAFYLAAYWSCVLFILLPLSVAAFFSCLHDRASDTLSPVFACLLITPLLLVGSFPFVYRGWFSPW